MYTDEFEAFYKKCPKKSEKISASKHFAKLSTKNKALVMKDIETRYKGTDKQYTPNPAKYLARKYYLEEGPTDESQPKEVVELPLCNHQGCLKPVHGPNYPSCADHLASNENQSVVERMREIYRKNGLVQREGESDKEHTLRLRKTYVRMMVQDTPVKDMDKYS